MNQNTVIYIILSAILLYLYYRKKDIAIFVAFVIVAGATLIFRGSMSCEGFVEGNTNRGGVDKVCAKLGFKPPKIDKNDIKGSLEKVIKDIKPIADKYWKKNIENKSDDKTDKTFEKNCDELEKKVMEIKKKNKNVDVDSIINIYIPTVFPYVQVINDKSMTDKIFNDKFLENSDKNVENSNSAIKAINMIKNSDEIKDLNKGSKQILNYLVCLGNHWISIYKAIQKAKDSGGDGDGEDEDDDDDDKKKKKKKKNTKKKSKKDDDDDDDE